MEEMTDLGHKPTETAIPEKSKESNKVSYPSVTIDKDIGLKMGQKVMMEGKVSGLRKDNYGDSTTIDIMKCGKAKSMSEDEYMDMSDEDKEKMDEKDVMSKENKDDKEE